MVLQILSIATIGSCLNYCDTSNVCNYVKATNKNITKVPSTENNVYCECGKNNIATFCNRNEYFDFLEQDCKEAKDMCVFDKLKPSKPTIAKNKLKNKYCFMNSDNNYDVYECPSWHIYDLNTNKCFTPTLDVTYTTEQLSPSEIMRQCKLTNKNCSLENLMSWDIMNDEIAQKLYLDRHYGFSESVIDYIADGQIYVDFDGPLSINFKINPSFNNKTVKSISFEILNFELKRVSWTAKTVTCYEPNINFVVNSDKIYNVVCNNFNSDNYYFGPYVLRLTINFVDFPNGLLVDYYRIIVS